MSVKEILQFICFELKKAINDSQKERILELGSAVDVLYEVAKKQTDKKSLSVLERMNYIVFHYSDESSFIEHSFQEIEKALKI